MVAGTSGKESTELPDEDASLEFGKQLAQSIGTGIIYFEGLLGAGKTTIVRGWLHGLGHAGNVKSPTYTIVESYDVGEKSILHIDLYRILDPSELEFIGLAEQISTADLVFIEWPRNGEGFLPSPDFTIEVQYKGDARLVTCSG